MQEEEEEVVMSKPKPQGWMSWFLSLPGHVFSYIFSIIRVPYDLIFGNSK